MTVTLGDISTIEAAAWSDGETLLVLPLGATEQHGPHLPLSTDTDIALALAHALAYRRPGVIVAPPIAYGASGEHADFTGTLSIGLDALELLLLELGRSAMGAFPRMLILCAHGGNRDAVAGAERRLRAERRDVRAFFPRFEGDAHAGHVETSIMLALRPSLVRLKDAAPGEQAPLAQILPRLKQYGVRSVSSNGVLGDPTSATAQRGRALLDRATDQMLDLVDSWSKPMTEADAGRRRSR